MDPKTRRKRQIAKRLGVSEQVLEQYLQVKRAEVVHPKKAAESADSSESGEPADPSEIPARERRRRQRHAMPPARASRRSADTERAADTETR